MSMSGMNPSGAPSPPDGTMTTTTQGAHGEPRVVEDEDEEEGEATQGEAQGA